MSWSRAFRICGSVAGGLPLVRASKHLRQIGTPLSHMAVSSTLQTAHRSMTTPTIIAIWMSVNGSNSKDRVQPLQARSMHPDGQGPPPRFESSHDQYSHRSVCAPSSIPRGRTTFRARHCEYPAFRPAGVGRSVLPWHESNEALAALARSVAA